ncbi:MAG: sulfur carrier protein ThiS [Alphaproteobacteria bacterium]
MRITLNGEPREVAAALTVEALLRAFDLDPKKVAVERNLEIVRRSEFSRLKIEDGDRLEIVHFIGGG